MKELNRQGFSAVEGILILLVVAVIGLISWYVLVSRTKSRFCYVRTDHLQCVDSSGNANRYGLPQVDGHHLTSLVPSPDGNSYIGFDSSSVFGLSNQPIQTWLLGKNLKSIAKININASAEESGRVFAVWSPNNQKVLFNDNGSFSVYDVAANKVTQVPGDPSGSEGENCLESTNYRFIDNQNILLASEIGSYLQQPDHANAYVLNLGTLKCKAIKANFKGVYSGTFTPLNDGKIIFHDGKTISVINTDGTGQKIVTNKISFSFYTYDPKTDLLYFAKKRLNSNGDTLGIDTISWVKADDFVNNGVQPQESAVNSSINAQDSPYLIPVSKTKVVIVGWNGAELYDLKSGHKVTSISPSPVIIPGDPSVNLEGIVGVLNKGGFPDTKGESLINKIYGIDTTPASFREYITGVFEQKDSQCQKDPGRYGSQLQAAIQTTTSSNVTVNFSCQVTGYFGKETQPTKYSLSNGTWSEAAKQ